MDDEIEYIKEVTKEIRGAKIIDVVVQSLTVDPYITIILDKGKLGIGMNDIGIYAFDFEPYDSAEENN